MVPLSTTPYADLRARFPRCLKQTYSTQEVIELIKSGPEDRPSNHPDHVFDTCDGYRVIITAEILEGKTFLHVSLSGWSDEARKRLAKEDKGLAYALRAFKRVAGLEGQTNSVAQCKRSKSGVVNLIFPLGDVSEKNDVLQTSPDLDRSR